MAEQTKSSTTPSKSKHPGGRPTKLTSKIVKLASSYIESAQAADELPTIEGLAIYIGITRSTLYEWRKIDGAENKIAAKLSDILDDVDTHQAHQLINGSLRGFLNPTISKMMLSKHGYVEKNEVDNSHKGEVVFTNDVPRPKRGDA